MTNPYKVGDILVSSWGYDQTNIDYFQVVRTSDKSVWIREIESFKHPEEGLQGTCMPDKDNFKTWSLMHKRNEAVRRNVQADGYVKVTDSHGARAWNFEPNHYTEWA
jgi:hypothetical protein